MREITQGRGAVGEWRGGTARAGELGPALDLDLGFLRRAAELLDLGFLRRAAEL